MPDARHVEDCMLYQGIAARVAGPGDDLTRVRRVFDWMVRQVQLVPVGSLGSQGLQQAYARPYRRASARDGDGGRRGSGRSAAGSSCRSAVSSGSTPGSSRTRPRA